MDAPNFGTFTAILAYNGSDACAAVAVQLLQTASRKVVEFVCQELARDQDADNALSSARVGESVDRAAVAELIRRVRKVGITAECQVWDEGLKF